MALQSVLSNNAALTTEKDLLECCITSTEQKAGASCAPEKQRQLELVIVPEVFSCGVWQRGNPISLSVDIDESGRFSRVSATDNEGGRYSVKGTIR